MLDVYEWQSQVSLAHNFVLEILLRFVIIELVRCPEHHFPGTDGS